MQVDLKGLIGAVLLLAVYFLPSYVGRHKRQFTALVLLNLLLGWTGLGWIGALVWAASKDQPAPAAPVVPARAAAAPIVASAPSVADEVDKLRRLRDAGELTNEEFLQQKARVLRHS